MKKTSFHHVLTLAAAAASVLQFAPKTHAQGSLTPPGGPAPLFKTLQQVEPRRPIESLPVTINQPGSYYLTGNLTGVAGQNGISIVANNVTLDLGGFALTGVAGSFDGVNVSVNVTNVSIRNGSVTRWGSMGVDADTAYNSQVIDIRAAHNGTRGIYLAGGGIVSGCTAQGNQDGIVVGAGSSVTGCSSSGNSNDGILASIGCTISGNSASGNTGDGIQVGNDSQVVNNTCDGNGAGAGSGAGIHLTGSNNRVVGNTMTSADRGLDIDVGGNFVADNTVVRNIINYDIVAGNQLNLLLGAIPQTISWPATIKLAGSLTGGAAQNGIIIISDDVAIDLDGHSLIGAAGSLDGIAISGSRTNISVRNGSVRGWGSDGIQAAAAYNSQFSGLRVANNGANGLQAGSGATVKDCQARGNGADGIVTSAGCSISDSTASENKSDGIVASTGSTVSGSTAYNNSFDGIRASLGSTVVNCSVYSNTNGISASDGSTVVNCTVNANATNGIVVGFGSTVTGCTLRDNRTGINVGDDCRVVNNAIDNATSAGIMIRGSDNRIDANNVSDSGRGIDCNLGGNLIVRNSVASSTVLNYDIVAGNTVGPVLGVANPIASTNPWANFGF